MEKHFENHWNVWDIRDLAWLNARFNFEFVDLIDHVDLSKFDHFCVSISIKAIERDTPSLEPKKD